VCFLLTKGVRQDRQNLSTNSPGGTPPALWCRSWLKIKRYGRPAQRRQSGLGREPQLPLVRDSARDSRCPSACLPSTGADGDFDAPICLGLIVTGSANLLGSVEPGVAKIYRISLQRSFSRFLRDPRIKFGKHAVGIWSPDPRMQCPKCIGKDVPVVAVTAEPFRWPKR